MKQKKYSESKIKAAQNFLSNYGLSFDCLSEPQKRIMINHTYSKKWLIFYLFVLLLGVLIFSVQGFIAYESLKYFIGKGADLSTYKPESHGKICFALGFTSCFFFSIASLLLLYTIFFPIFKKIKLKTLDAFLPSLKQPSDDNQTPSNQNTAITT